MYKLYRRVLSVVYKMSLIILTLSCPGTGRAVVKIGHSNHANLWPGSKELILKIVKTKVHVHLKLTQFCVQLSLGPIGICKLSIYFC